ncbi:glycosyltransferase family 1 protein [Butyrivibrio sp. CB08]|uniref:glycosyltransferase family 4 protein n=1 Tax=Butyrivibrio sp. CB08 TaxID=2364879 RepID=UPI000EA874F0|nr:glycosyltransferase family 4 protein [Butyrivibrio sp. CB08]RKM57796.1 glycosyltransferase family 1 protein [Butyrivibrio sp. CB08]
MSDRLKILMIGPDRRVHGGISALMNSYCEAGLQDKVELKYIGTMKEGSKLKKLMVAGLAFIDFMRSVDRYDIVHVNCSSDSSFMRKSYFIRYAKRRGKKVLLHQHGGDFVNYYNNEISDKKRAYIREILDMADLMLVLTNQWKDFFGGLTDGNKIHVLPNGIVTEGVNTPAPGTKDMNKILFLGRICLAKGVKELVAAVHDIHETNDKVKLYLGGIFEDPELIDDIEENSTFVKHIGWVSGEDKNKWLDECGIMAVPSYFEGFGLSVVEGMLHGCCVVASNVGGIPDIVEDEVDGLLVEPKDEDSLRNAIERVMNDKDLADKLSGNGVKKARDKYSIENIETQLLSYYEEISG